MNKLLSKLQIEQYENDGYVVPDFKMPEDTLKKIEERHDELLKPFSLSAYDNNFWDKGVNSITTMIDELETL